MPILGAGLRTNALVATGASAFVVLSALMPGDSSPTRIAAQVVSGIGFLGAGVILREGLNVRGLNTAATLWCSAAVGTLAGSGFWLAAALTTAVVVLSNVALRPLGPLIARQLASGTELEVAYQLSASCSEDHEFACSSCRPSRGRPSCCGPFGVRIWAGRGPFGWRPRC